MILMMKEYRVTSPYGPRMSPLNRKQEFHTGIDLVKPAYAKIQAFVAGTVVYANMGQAGTGVGGFGNTVIIKDKDNHLHLYAHLSDYCVSVGQFVVQGQVIGRQGNTGKSSGQHLHYEVRKNGSSFGFGNHMHPVKYVDDFYARECPQPEKKPVDKVSIEINGKLLSDQGYLKDGISTLPVRAVSEAAGVTPEWCPTTQQVKVAGHDLTETIEAGVSYAPARELAAALGLQVEWVQEIKTVKLKGCVTV
ncbi:peptidoglycan DD-metalloendopeptidase family protein [Brevibacillus sp. HB2.2]|uniref:peptidoglycan DD-metalloendopeptidase family protein n=1 Tax=Brevibacillus sp. HB2.2 TaxID=2738846 RepID=UPI00156A79A2|nr:peptidoglycan DD-metalloendopeptidase family protein [Brevibacillus sp. HB2.2]NRS50952.1 peptidoglycan DD-metalloendopeptidase family protein [Brevibacillus sp. HB2.2]